jgi:acyl-CoA thioester hydrolase
MQDVMTIYRFSHRLRVRWGECDMQGIVFNPHYMLYFDVAFTEYWRAIGMTYPDALAAEGVDNFMVAAELRYRDAARYDDELDIFVRTAYVGTTSFRMGFSIRRANTILVEGTGTYVIGDRVSRAPRSLPERFINAVLAYEAIPPDRKKPAAPSVTN